MLWLPIDRSLEKSLITQVYEQIRKKILTGQLQSHEKLPSTRQMAADLAVSRNVILEAYDQLLAEGFLVARRGSGTYVAVGAFLKTQVETPDENVLFPTNETSRIDDLIDFRSGIPALDLFPRNIWAKLSSSVWNDSCSSLLGYDLPEGRLELRHALSSYLQKTRGVVCHPNQIVITSGATQAMTLVSKLLLSSDDTVIMEDPITVDIQMIFRSAGAIIHPIPVDNDGMITSSLPANKPSKFVYITPSHQFPLGGTLPIQRRIQLINYSRETNCFLIEDDYDSEFRHEGPPVSSLQGLDPERVLYIGSFSKILSPALRMGYVILPSPLIEKCRQLKWFSDLHTPSLDQLVLARFIQEGHLERHITRMKKVYKNRRDFLTNCLQATFSNKVEVIGDSTGLHLIAGFKGKHFSEEWIEKTAQQFQVKLYSVEDHTIKKGQHSDKIILGYGHMSQSEIEEGITRLRKAIDELN